MWSRSPARLPGRGFLAGRARLRATGVQAQTRGPAVWLTPTPQSAPSMPGPIPGSDVVMDDFLGPAPRGGWSVRDIVRGAGSLSGVGGVLLVGSMGDVIARELPGLCSEQALSAFLRQVFESVDACAREIGQDGVDRLSLTMGGMPWRLYKANQSFLLFMGKPGEHLPMVQLELVAAELARRV